MFTIIVLLQLQSPKILEISESKTIATDEQE